MYSRPAPLLGTASVYTPSACSYRPPDDPEYSFHDRSVRATQCGRICIGNRKISMSTVFVGIREVADKIWLVRTVAYASDTDLFYLAERDS